MRKDLLFLVPLSVFFLTFGLGKTTLGSWDEGMYAAVAREILYSGDWWRLRLEGAVWFDKPPLFFWATAFFFKILGVHEFSARLFPALCGVGTVVVTYLFGSRLFNRWVGFLSALVLLNLGQFLRFARLAQLDIPLTFFFTLSLYFFWLGQFKNRYLLLSGAAIGLAFMTKNFAAFLIPAVTWIYCLCAGRTKILSHRCYWIGILVAVAIALPWHWFAFRLGPDEFTRNVLVGHFWVFIAETLKGHLGMIYYYAKILFQRNPPWMLVGVISAPFFLLKAVKDREPVFIFLSAWMFFIFGLLSLMFGIRYPYYILPIYPALSISIGYLMAKIFSENYVHFMRILFIVSLVLHFSYSEILRNDYGSDIKGIQSLVVSVVPPAETLYFYDYSSAALFYLERKRAYLYTPQAFLSKAAEKNFFCLVHEKNLKQLYTALPRLGLSVKGSYGKLSLVSKSDLPPI